MYPPQAVQGLRVQAHGKVYWIAGVVVLFAGCELQRLSFKNVILTGPAL